MMAARRAIVVVELAVDLRRAGGERLGRADGHRPLGAVHLVYQDLLTNAGDVVYGERDLYHAVGDRPDNPTLVVGTDARGADQWAYGQSGASNFETWADVARRFKRSARCLRHARRPLAFEEQ